MAKQKPVKQTNPVAKYAVQFNHAKVFRDRTKYKRTNKGALRKSLLPFLFVRFSFVKLIFELQYSV